MNKMFIGKYVNTHGIKGEIRILSKLNNKEIIFKIGNKIIINDIEYKIASYRIHKNFDMITLEGINDINKIPFNKNTNVYINRDNLENNHFDTDLIGYKIINNNINEIVTDIEYLKNNHKLLRCNKKLIPFELIEKIDYNNKLITVKDVINL